MISVEPSRSGAPVLLKDGKYLGSSVDPVREGEKWAVAAIERLGDAESAVILGLGSGYHVRELMRRKPTIPLLVIETDKDIAREAKRLVPDVTKVKLVVESDWSRLLEHADVRAVTHEFFRCLMHAPSCQTEPLFYQRAEAMLLARDRVGFFLQLRDRQEFLRAVDMKKIETIPVGPVSIKTILPCLRPVAGEAYEREALVWRALGELVK